MTDLELIATDDLITELLRRYDHAIFAGYICKSDDASEIHRHSTGNRTTCVGLASQIAHRLNTEILNQGEAK